MFCFVDYRNRPQCRYTFHSRDRARDYLRKIKNNPFGATVIHADGRREYFESGLPARFAIPQSGIAGKTACANNLRILKGCHVKYRIRPLQSLDGLAARQGKQKESSVESWQSKLTPSFFMLGNLKFSTCLLIVSVAAFSFSYMFQKNLGQAAVADELGGANGIVLGAVDSRDAENVSVVSDDSPQLAGEDVILNLLGKAEKKRNESFEKEILTYIKGQPMEKMAPYIAKQPRMVAAFIVGIAMKESKFGVYAPHNAAGRDCYNYWGYKGLENTTASGYSCFNSPEHAIQVVGKKINSLVAKGISNPAQMISWKCGSSCAGHGAENVRKWIADVGINFYKLNSKGNS